jgi:hypothetical protein
MSRRETHRRRLGLAILCVVGTTLKLAATAAAGGMIWIHLCGSWTPGTSPTGGQLGVARSGSSTSGLTPAYQCPATSGGTAYGMWVLGDKNGVPAGSRAYWEIDAPSGLSIIGVHTVGDQGMASFGVNANVGWGGGFYWKGGGATATPGEIHFSSPLINSPYFGWQVICGATTCNGASKPGEITVLELELEAMETSGPSLSSTPGSLGATTGWVRGRWPIAFTADGPSGACQLSAALGGISVSQPVNEPQVQTTWHQCSAGSFSQDFDTASVGSGGGIPLTMSARDAAYDYTAGRYLASTVSKSVNLDNAPVMLSLSGPTDAPSTAGTQYITATATAGPSGVAGIACSVDGSPYQLHAGASTQIPLRAIGSHTASCYAQNNAVNSNGTPATSALQTWTLTIRQPSVSTVSFARVVDSLRCARKRERVRIPGRWVTGTSNGRPVRIKLPPETRTVRVVHCHPRIVQRRVLIRGRWRRVPVVLLPHTVQATTRRIRHGATTTVSGWLGTLRGNALGGQQVAILTAADNGRGRFRAAAVTTTAPNGGWTARLPAGPSRIVRVTYGGTNTVEPSSSAPAQLVVPASVRLTISPRNTHWGGRIMIQGRLRGGYVPPKGELVVLRIGWPGGSTEIGHLYARRDGRFHSTYTFLRGNGTETYWLWAATATETDYPFASSRSRRTTVTVGP